MYELKPLLSNNKDKWGLALDGQLKHEDTNLASSTLVHEPHQKENLGIIVQYKVKVRSGVWTSITQVFTFLSPGETVPGAPRRGAGGRAALHVDAPQGELRVTGVIGVIRVIRVTFIVCIAAGARARA